MGVTIGIEVSRSWKNERRNEEGKNVIDWMGWERKKERRKYADLD